MQTNIYGTSPPWTTSPYSQHACKTLGTLRATHSPYRIGWIYFTCFTSTRGWFFHVLCTFCVVPHNMFSGPTTVPIYTYNVHIRQSPCVQAPLPLGLNGQLNEITSRILENRFFIIPIHASRRIALTRKRTETFYASLYSLQLKSKIS